MNNESELPWQEKAAREIDKLYLERSMVDPWPTEEAISEIIIRCRKEAETKQHHEKDNLALG